MNSPAKRLQLFGFPVLADADGVPIGGGAAQAHRIAILAFLALSKNRTAAREELTSILWPGRDQKEANQLLNRELFSINKVLGDDAIFSNAKEVRLGSRVTVDAIEFQQALDEGRPGDAMEIHTGPLLEDFTLDNSPDFESWAANQRERFATARKSLRPVGEGAADVEHDSAEPEPEVVREPPKKRPSIRKRRKSRSEVAPPPEPEPPREERPAMEEPPAPEPEPDIPAVDSNLEVHHSGQEVFWSPESAPEIGRAAQRSTPDVTPPPSRRSDEVPTEAEPRVELTTPDFSRFAPPPPVPPRIEPDGDVVPRSPEPAISRSPEPVISRSPEPVMPRSPEPAMWGTSETPTLEPTIGPPADVDEPVEFIELPQAPPPPPEPKSAPAPRKKARKRRSLPRIPLPSARLTLTVLVLVLLGGVGYWARGKIVDAGAAARSAASDAGAKARAVATELVDARTRARSIAVLPLEFTGSDPADQVLAAGIADNVRRMLSQSGARVMPADMFAYRTPPFDVRSIAETLGVPHVLQGAMRRDGAQLLFRFQLVNATGDTTRWDQTYAPKAADILTLEEDVAITVARQILEQPSTHLVTRPTENAAAYQLVLRGYDAMARPDAAAREALEFFRQAVALDSGYARAWAGLARAYLRATPSLPAAERDRQLALANQAAQRAVAIDSSLAESQAALGLARLAMFDVAEAETHLQRALALEPTRATNDAIVDLYLWSGRAEQALPIAERALERDTLSPHARSGVAFVLAFMNRCDEAVTHLDRIPAALRPARAAAARALCQAQAGRWNDAVVATRSAVTPRDSSLVSLLAFMLQRAGNNAESRRIAGVVNDRVPRGRGSALDLALLDAGARNFEAAARRVQEAIDARSFLAAPGVELATLMSPVFQELHQQQGFIQARSRFARQ